MADIDIQLLLDPASNGRGVMILQRTGGASDTLNSYYVRGVVTRGGRSKWVDVTRTDSDAQKATAILAALVS
jgi:hypothetical protein